MLLHRYFNSHAFETLKEAKLKASRISSFNDSFEFLYVCEGKTTPAEMRKFVTSRVCDPVLLFDAIELNQKSASPISDAELKIRTTAVIPSLTEHGVKIWPDIVKQTELPLERRRQIIDQELRAICFSDASRVKRMDEILLWSHYAKRSEGIRIGFEFPDGIKEPFGIRPITYQESRVAVVWSVGEEKPTLEALEQSATVKCTVWEYEKEFRLFTKTTSCEQREIKKCGSSTTLECFLNFSREWVKSVDLGVFCSDSDVKTVVDLLKTDYPKIVPRKAEFHETEYAFEYKPVS